MKPILSLHLEDALRLTQSGRLMEATASLQRMLGGQAEPASGGDAPDGPPTIDGVAEPVGGLLGLPGLAAGEGGFMNGGLAGFGASGLGVPSFGVPSFGVPSFGVPNLGGIGGLGARKTDVAVPDEAQFIARSYSGTAGTRPYRLYVPSGYRGEKLPLIVMLHGCSQSPEDFAAGTRMNAAAEAQTCLVVYPGQTSSANMQRCWNWFNEADQRRDGGEAALIAGITREVMADYAVDPARVYVAGLSAGGAAAAIMGDAYPDLYAAIGVHSGLACGAARDMPSAFAAMQGGGVVRPSHGKPVVPAIVFHGERDTTVAPRNGEAVVAQSSRGAALRETAEAGQVPGGHAYSRTLHHDEGGRVVIEHWVVRGAGHAWFGGSPAGTYTDARGPDATGEMLRFFLQHENAVAGRA